MKRLALKLINFYQKKVSPNTNKKCRYSPSCSSYAKECYETFNFFKASFLSLRRILKCSPFFEAKYDPVPKHKNDVIPEISRRFSIDN